MLVITLSLFALIFSLGIIVNSKLPILNGFLGNIVIFIFVFFILFLIALFILRIMRWVEIINKETHPTEKINISDAFKREEFFQYAKIALAFGMFLLVINFAWDKFFQKTYVCRDESDQIYFLVLSADGSAYVYNNDKKYISSTTFHNIGKNRFIGESGWEGWPGTEKNSMVVQYRDKSGAVKNFYKACLLKKSFF